MTVAIDDQYMPTFRGCVKSEKLGVTALEMYSRLELLCDWRLKP